MNDSTYISLLTCFLSLLYLHSFPTRRSSDLLVWITELAYPPEPEWEIIAIASRSEEHTSELQSRPHLVCRLLLEKKNIIIAALNNLPRRLGRPDALAIDIHMDFGGL